MALNLKFRITGDASGVKKATKEASAAVKSFEKEGKGALSSLGSALGINISSIERMGDAFAGAVLKMRGGADESAEKISKLTGLLKGVGLAAGAMAAAGVAAWKAMTKEAEFYGNTLEGLADAAGLQSYLDTLILFGMTTATGPASRASSQMLRRAGGSWATMSLILRRPDLVFRKPPICPVRTAPGLP
jgi:hypothetical protein